MAELWTALVTPFKNNEVDYNSLELCLRAQGDNGIVLFGSTGEGMTLDTDEKVSIIDFAKNLKLSNKIMLGVPAFNIKSTLEWVEIANDFNLDGYMITPAIYARPGVVAQTKWFEAILNKAKSKCMLYNNPGRVGVALHIEVVKGLLSHENWYGVKDSGGTVESFKKYKATGSKVLCGDDNMLEEFVKISQDGLVTIAGNAWPKAVRKHLDFFIKGKSFDKTVWNTASNTTVTANPISIKHILKNMGIIASEELRLPLYAEDLPANTLIKESISLMSMWETENK